MNAGAPITIILLLLSAFYLVEDVYGLGFLLLACAIVRIAIKGEQPLATDLRRHLRRG